MIRINLLKPAIGVESGADSGRPRPGGGWISPRELGIGAFVLVAGGTLLFYLESRPNTPARVRPKQTKVISFPSPAPALPEPGRPEPAAKVETPPPAPAPVEKAKLEPATSPDSKPREAPPPKAENPKPEPPAPSKSRGAERFQVSEVTVRRQPQSLTVMVRVEPGAKYREMKLSSPPRLVIDIPNSHLTVPAGQRLQRVNHRQVKTVRASQFQTDPAISRIVLDVTSMPRYEIRPGPAGLEIRVLGGNL